MIERRPLEIGVFADIEVAKKYDKEARIWARYVAKSFVSVAKKWGIARGLVLDVGTGTGTLALEFARSLPGIEVVGLDLSKVVLELARENAQDSDVSSRVSFEHGDAEEMPFEDETFDLVVSSNTLHLIKNPIRMSDEIQRVLNPKGKFLISDFRRSWLGLFGGHLRASYTPHEVRELLSKSSLKHWQVQDRFFWLTIISKT